jgi:uncharacterized protein with PIN domain
MGTQGGAQPRYPVTVRFAPALRMFLDSRHRASGRAEVSYDTTSSLGHVIESLGVPLPEVGELLIGWRRAQACERVPRGRPVLVRAVSRPQRLPGSQPRFCLDVHLGTLARRMRLLGLDAAYRNDASDDELIADAAAQDRVLLTQDRGLLRRRAVRCGAFVRGAGPDSQLADVLDRFAPPLRPWTRCTACNGLLEPAAKPEVEYLLLPGTRRTYDVFARCRSCGKVYWRGAHGRRLATLVESARRMVDARAQNTPGSMAAVRLR